MRFRFAALMLFAGLTFVSVPQQARAQAPSAQTSALPGPRQTSPAPAVKYRIPGETGHENDAMRRRSQTITISTLALVLGVILLVVLIS